MSAHQTDKSNDMSIAVMQQLAEVRGQLVVMTQLMQNNHAATQTRIEDLRSSMDSRFETLEGRMGHLEQNERKTAISSAISGALSGAVVSASLAALKLWSSH